MFTEDMGHWLRATVVLGALVMTMPSPAFAPPIMTYDGPIMVVWARRCKKQQTIKLGSRNHSCMMGTWVAESKSGSWSIVSLF